MFGSCIIHVLYKGCAKIKKNNSCAKRVTDITKCCSALTFRVKRPKSLGYPVQEFGLQDPDQKRATILAMWVHTEQ